ELLQDQKVYSHEGPRIQCPIDHKQPQVISTVICNLIKDAACCQSFMPTPYAFMPGALRSFAGFCAPDTSHHTASNNGSFLDLAKGTMQRFDTDVIQLAPERYP